MAGEPDLIIEGNLTRNPEQHGDVITFTIAQNVWRRDRNGQKQDMPTVFMNCAAFGTLGQNILTTCRQGMKVIAKGTLHATEWTDKNTGQKRSALELTVNNLGISLQYATAQVTRNEPQNNGYQQAGQQNYSTNNYQAQQGYGTNYAYQQPQTAPQATAQPQY